MPAEPQPQREQRPPPEWVAHDHPERGAERRHVGELVSQGQALPREQGAEQQRPDEIADQRMSCHTDLLGSCDVLAMVYHRGNAIGCACLALFVVRPPPFGYGWSVSRRAKDRSPMPNMWNSFRTDARTGTTAEVIAYPGGTGTRSTPTWPGRPGMSRSRASSRCTTCPAGTSSTGSFPSAWRGTASS